MRISVLIPNSNNQEMQIKLEFIKRNVKAGLATVGEFPCFTRGWAAETMQESFAFAHSGSWQAQGGPVYIRRHQINMFFITWDL